MKRKIAQYASYTMAPLLILTYPMTRIGEKLAGVMVQGHSSQRGDINIAGLMMMGIAMIFLAVGFIIYPLIIDATDDVLAYSGNVSGTLYDITDFTGLSSVVNVTPLLVLIGFVTAGAVTGFMGLKLVRGQAGGGLNPGAIMMLGIGLIFIAVALIIFPVVLDGVAEALDAAITAGTYTGLEAVLGVTPLIVLVAFLAGGVVMGFFGIRSQASAMR